MPAGQRISIPSQGSSLATDPPSSAIPAASRKSRLQSTTGLLPPAFSSCTADTRVLIEGTFGIWFKPYDGSKEDVNRGRIQWGPQFSYVDRNTWSGVGGEPHGLDGMIFTSFRYYLP